MSKSRIVFAALALAVVSVGCSSALASGEHPPHVARPTAGASVLAAISGADHPGEVIEFKEGERRAEWFAGVARAEAEAARAREVASRPIRVPAGGAVGGDCAALASQLGLSPDILWRESRCQWVNSDPSFCSNRGCLGPAQIDSGHFRDVSPWNGNVPGTCAGLDPNNPADYAECVSRLPDSAW